LHNARLAVVGRTPQKAPRLRVRRESRLRPVGSPELRRTEVEAFGKFVQVQRIDRDGLARSATPSASSREPRAGSPPRGCRDPLSRRGAASVPRRPGSDDEPDARLDGSAHRPAGYVWEATTEQVAARYGVPVERIVRFDLNTAPDHRGRADGTAGGRFERTLGIPAVRLPSARGGASARYGVPPTSCCRCRRGRDPGPRREGLPAGRRIGDHPHPVVRDVSRPHRAARRARVACRVSAPAGASRSTCRRCARGRDAAVIWLCSPNNPTGVAEPDGVIADLAGGRRCDTAVAGTEAPIVSWTRRTPSSSGRPSSGSASSTRACSSYGPRARPTGSPDCGSDSRSAPVTSSPGWSPIDASSVSTVSWRS